MKSRFAKIAVFTVLVSVLGSVLLMGCGGSTPDDTTANAPTKPGAPPPAPKDNP